MFCWTPCKISNNVGNKEELIILNEKISDEEAEINRNKIFNNFQKLSQNPENVNLGNVWKLMNKIWPKCAISLPTAKIDHKGKVTSAPGAIKNLLAKEYKERLRTRPIRYDMKHLKEHKKRMFEMKMRLAENTQSKKWTMCDLELAHRNNKSRDPEGLINEIFKQDVIGSDLKYQPSGEGGAR